jgi:hypothetical protein
MDKIIRFVMAMMIGVVSIDIVFKSALNFFTGSKLYINYILLLVFIVFGVISWIITLSYVKLFIINKKEDIIKWISKKR